MRNKNPMRFYYKEKTKTKQGYDKKNVLKISVEQTKDNGEFYLYLYLLGT